MYTSTQESLGGKEPGLFLWEKLLDGFRPGAFFVLKIF
jgi:hypothetical protein